MHVYNVCVVHYENFVELLLIQYISRRCTFVKSPRFIFLDPCALLQPIENKENALGNWIKLSQTLYETAKF